MDKRVIVAVGSANPVKVSAVKSVFSKLFTNPEVKGVNASSGVSEQPLSDNEAVKGAENRAIAAQKECSADFGIGLEGATIETPWGMFLTGWIAVADQKGIIGRASGGRIPLPDSVSEWAWNSAL